VLTSIREARMIQLRPLLPLAFVLPLMAACAPRAQSAATSNANQLLRSDLVDYSTVWDAIQAQRSRWFNRRTPLYLEPRSPTGVRDANPVWVYRDGQQIGNLDVLRNMTTVEIELVQYFDPRTATLRWGTNHENGAILVVSRAWR
jgi:hypothetical protein